MMPKAPCLGCNQRSIGCHSICERYIDYQAQMESINAERKKAQEEQSFAFPKRVARRKKNKDFYCK